MRAIEDKMIQAIKSGKGMCSGNTAVVHEAAQNDGSPVVRISLHGNHIANVYTDRVMVTLAGWPTPTTRSRLNAILREFTPGRTNFFQYRREPMFAERGVERPVSDTAWITVPRA